MRKEDRKYIFLFLGPSVVLLFLLTIYPLIFSIKLSFYDWDLLSPRELAHFVGFSNYIEIFKSEKFWKAVYVTFIFLSGVGLEMVIGFCLALLLSKKFIGRGFVRTAIVSAMVLTPVVVGTMWRLMYYPKIGIINYFLDVLRIGGRSWLAEKTTVLPALIITDTWEWSPLVMLIMLAGIQALPEEIFEAAKVDGASTYQLFKYIQLPLLTPYILLALLIRIMDSFRTFDTIYAMTGGGPGTESQTINILMYYEGFEFFHMSYTSALAVVSLIIVTFICLTLTEIFRRKEWL